MEHLRVGADLQPHGFGVPGYSSSKRLEELPTRSEQEQAEAVQLYRLAAEQAVAGAQFRGIGLWCMPRVGVWRKTTRNPCGGFG